MFARVVPLRRLPSMLSVLDYHVPPKLQSSLAPGVLVIVPLQKGEIYGIVESISNEGTQNPKIKDIISIALTRALINENQLKFFKELALVYHTPLGFILKTALPTLNKRRLAELAVSKPLPPQTEQLGLALTKERRPKIYFYAAGAEKKKTLKNFFSSHGTSLCLVPEVNEIDRVKALVPRAIAKKTLVFHAGITLKEKFAVWQRVYNSEPALIIGTRGALFLPWQELRQICLIDEANPSHKSFDMAPRFHTQDVAERLALIFNTELNIVTHTPSLKSFWSLETHRYAVLRGQKVPKSAVQIIDMFTEERGGNRGSISEELTTELLKNKTGVTFLFLNRRGDWQYVACGECNTPLVCPTCATTLTYYSLGSILRCRHCFFKQPMALACQKCGSSRLRRFGAGVATIQKEVSALALSGRRILLIQDEPTAPAKLTFLPGDIVIGTQFAWNKIPWKKITLMAFVDPDTAFFIPDYQATFDLWQRLREASFLLKNPPYVQTRHPGHQLFSFLRDPEAFYTSELNARRVFNYPPFSTLVKIGLAAKTPVAAEHYANDLYRKIMPLTNGNSHITISEPMVPWPERLGAYSRRILIIKINTAKPDLLHAALSVVPDFCKVDINPANLLSPL